MSKPQVLVFIDWYSPGFKAGGPVRSLVNLVDHLRDRIDFHIVTSDTEYTETMPYPGIAADRWTTLPGGEKVWYASREGTRRSVWVRLLKERAWDVVYINGMWSRWYSVLPLWLLRGSRQRRIAAVRGMLAAGVMAHGAAKKRLFLAAMELFGCYRGVEFQATSAEEVEDVKRWIATDAKTHLVPNLGRKVQAEGPPQRAKEPGELKLVSLARIAVEKNTLFAIERLHGLAGNITFDLYGPVYDDAYWQQCRKAIAALPANVRVTHKGTVSPEQVPALLGDYHALFMPSQGENFGHTMAESLATGLPLLISDRTPWKNLEGAHAGWDLSLDDPAGFEQALKALVSADRQVFQRLSEGAFTMGRRYLSDPAAVERNFALFAQ